MKRALLTRYAHLLADMDAQRQRIQNMKADLVYLPYDWALNDAALDRASFDQVYQAEQR